MEVVWSGSWAGRTLICFEEWGSHGGVVDVDGRSCLGRLWRPTAWRETAAHRRRLMFLAMPL
jgi:hypothetical protein